MKKAIYILLAMCIVPMLWGAGAHFPQLVVVIVLDQVPYDYIVRFQPYFAEGGINYVLHHGADFTDAEYPYAYTKTACGHAAVITGTSSHVNGIVGNAWYDRSRTKRVNCVDDEAEQIMGGHGTGRSPRALLVNTVGDLVRMRTNSRSKVIGISNKDRSAILMAGKLGTAYWIDDSIFVSSSYYMKALPPWVVEFNRSGMFRKYFGQVWKELKPSAANAICDKDDVPYEDNPDNMGRAFPHRITGTDTSRITESYYDALDHSPFTTEILLKFVRLAFERESLAVRGAPDLLCIGISATDIIGHSYGPNSHEVFDNMLRTDALLADFFSFLDKKIGLGNCLIAVTADHGTAPIPEYTKSISPELNTVRISSSEISSRANRMLSDAFGVPTKSWIVQTVDANIYLRDETVKEKGIPVETVRQALKDSLANDYPIDRAYTYDELIAGNRKEDLYDRVRLSFYPPRSGDVMILVRPFCIIDGATTGTNHGMPYAYDTHVPLILCGPGVKHGVYDGRVSPIDIAPTIAAILGMEFSPQCEGKVLSEAISATK